MRPKSRFALALLPFSLGLSALALLPFSLGLSAVALLPFLLAAPAAAEDCSISYEWKLDTAKKALAAHPEDRLYEFTDDQLAGFKAGLMAEAKEMNVQLLIDAVPHVHNVLVLEYPGGAELGFMFDDCFIGPDKITPERWNEMKGWAHIEKGTGTGTGTQPEPQSSRRFNFPGSYLLRI